MWSHDKNNFYKSFLLIACRILAYLFDFFQSKFIIDNKILKNALRPYFSIYKKKMEKYDWKKLYKD